MHKHTAIRGNTRVGRVASNNVSAGMLRRYLTPFKQRSDSTATKAAIRLIPGIVSPITSDRLTASVIPARP